MSFLPEGYKKIPSNSDYMKFQDGENTLRILSSAVVGYVYWTNAGKDSKPVRSAKPFNGIPVDIRVDKEGMPESIRHFWAFVVYNYDEERIQILEVTQKQVQTQLKAIVENQRWGDPKQYDITVNKSGTGFDTEYVVQPNPPIGPADPKIAEAYAQKTVNLEALFTGADPFAASKAETPAGVVTKAEAQKAMANEPLDAAPIDGMA